MSSIVGYGQIVVNGEMDNIENIKDVKNDIENERNVYQLREATPTDVVSKDDRGYIIFGKWACDNGIIVALENNVLTISGNGILGNDVKEIISETICRREGANVRCIIDKGITEIPSEMFYNLKGLSRINIPNSVVNIGSKAFYGCTSLNMGILIQTGQLMYLME